MIVRRDNWKRTEREAAGAYRPGELVDAYDVMRLEDAVTPINRPWNIFFFSPDSLVTVGLDVGREQDSPVVMFDEPTSFPHLEHDGIEAHQNVQYYYVQFRKPAEQIEAQPVEKAGGRRLNN